MKWKNIKRLTIKVSNTGLVYNLDKHKLCRIILDKDGYELAVLQGKELREDGRGFKTLLLKVHRLVLEAFIGRSKLQVNHKDLNKRNNKLKNLEYVTCSENAKHRINNGKIGSCGSGEQNGGSKLTWKIVRKARKLYSTNKYSHKSLANKLSRHYGVTIANKNLYYILNNKTWKENQYV